MYTGKCTYTGNFGGWVDLGAVDVVSGGYEL